MRQRRCVAVAAALRGSACVLLGLLLSEGLAAASGIFAEADSGDTAPLRPAPAVAPAQSRPSLRQAWHRGLICCVHCRRPTER